MSSEGGSEGGVRRLGQNGRPERKEAGGRGKGRRDNQKTLANNMKYARTVSRGLLALWFEAPVSPPAQIFRPCAAPGDSRPDVSNGDRGLGGRVCERVLRGGQWWWG